MNTFDSAKNQPFYSYFQPYNRNSLQLNNVTKQNRVHVMRKTMTSFSSLTGYAGPFVKCPEVKCPVLYIVAYNDVTHS